MSDVQKMDISWDELKGKIDECLSQTNRNYGKLQIPDIVKMAIVKMKDGGASNPETAGFVQKKMGFKISRTTISYRMREWKDSGEIEKIRKMIKDNG